MLKLLLSALSVAATLSALSGCAAFEYSEQKPLVQRESNSERGIDVFALKASHRLAYSQSKDSPRRMCSEPPPDVATSFSDSIRAAVSAAASAQTKALMSAEKSGEISENARAELTAARDFVTAVSQIYTRSQGVQVFRDGSFMLCQAHLNEALVADQRDVELKVAKVDLAKRDNNANPSPLQLETRRLELFPNTKPEPSNKDVAAGRNYTEQFRLLLTTTQAILEKEVPYLYKYDVDAAKKAAVDAQGKAEKAAGQVATAQTAAEAAEKSAAASKDEAAKSAAAAAKSADDAKNAAGQKR